MTVSMCTNSPHHRRKVKTHRDDWAGGRFPMENTQH